MMLAQLNGIARDSFILRDKKGDPVSIDPASPQGPHVTHVTLNGQHTTLIVPTIAFATDGNSPEQPLLGQYDVEFATNYTGAAAGDVIVLRIDAAIQGKTKTALLRFVIDPGDTSEPYIDVN